jgi:hypothetical protein
VDFSALIAPGSKVKELSLTRNTHLTNLFSLCPPISKSLSPPIVLQKLDVSFNNKITDLTFLTYLTELVVVGCAGLRNSHALPFQHVPKITLHDDTFGRGLSLAVDPGFPKGGLPAISQVFGITSFGAQGLMPIPFN